MQLVLGRAPRGRLSCEVLGAALSRFRTYYQCSPRRRAEVLEPGRITARPEPRSPSELAAYTGVASLLLNLDETMTKE